MSKYSLCDGVQKASYRQWKVWGSFILKRRCLKFVVPICNILWTLLILYFLGSRRPLTLQHFDAFDDVVPRTLLFQNVWNFQNKIWRYNHVLHFSRVSAWYGHKHCLEEMDFACRKTTCAEWFYTTCIVPRRKSFMQIIMLLFYRKRYKVSQHYR